MDTPGLGFRLGGCEPAPQTPAPALGERGRALLQELGMDTAAIERLQRSGVLGAALP